MSSGPRAPFTAANSSATSGNSIELIAHGHRVIGACRNMPDVTPYCVNRAKLETGRVSICLRESRKIDHVHCAILRDEPSGFFSRLGGWLARGALGKRGEHLGNA
jgi:hypothetical protein